MIIHILKRINNFPPFSIIDLPCFLEFGIIHNPLVILENYGTNILKLNVCIEVQSIHLYVNKSKNYIDGIRWPLLIHINAEGN